MARKSFVATVVGLAALVVPNAFADKGGIPHTGSNGQGRPAATQQTAATAPHGKALAKGHAKTHGTSHATTKTHPAGRALAKGHANSHVVTHTHTTPVGPPTTNTHARAGKTTICHATGSATNPYVEITISNNAIPAHQRHQDGRDIIPAPQGGCPGGQEQGGQQGGHEGKTTICHATGSATNPYVEITISDNAIPAHQAHQDGRDIIPAPATGCPGVLTPQQPVEQPQTPGSVLQQQAAASPMSGVLGSTTSGSSDSSPKVRVLGATTSGRAPSASTSPAATTTRPASSSKLPFTGTDAIIVAILGLAALLLGLTARRIAATKGTKA